MSDTNNGPPGSLPSPDFQKGLIPLAPSSLHPRHPRASLHRSAESQQGITPQFVLTAIRQWWKVAAPIGVVLAAISVAVVYLLFQPKYKATAWVQIEDTRPYIAFPDSGSSKTFVNTQVQLIRSPLVLGPVRSRPDIARIPEMREQKDPFGWLQKRLEVKQVGKSELFNISYTGPEPEDSARLVNAVVDEYFSLRDRKEAERLARVVELLEEERSHRAEEVDRLRENVRTLTKQATGKDPFAVNPQSHIVVQRPLSSLEARYAAAEVERAVLKAQIKEYQESVFGLGTRGTTRLGRVVAVIRRAKRNNDLVITPTKPEPVFTRASIEFVHDKAKGNQAFVRFDDDRILSIDIDPAATTAKTVIAAVNSQGTFTAALDVTADPTNDGTGLVGESLFGLGTKGTTQLTAGRVAAVVRLANQNNDLVITAPKPEAALTNVDIVFVHKDADGDRAIVSFDDANRTLCIDVDPAATTAKTVIAAVNSQDTFTAALDFTADSTNDGTGFVGALDPKSAIAPCGTATVRLDGDNDDFIVTASTPGPDFENVDVVLKHQAAIGNEALVTFDAESPTLTVDIDPTATTAKTVVDAINAEKTFIAELDRAADPDNDGSGLVSKTSVTVPHAEIEKELAAHPEVQAMQASLMMKEAMRREYERKLVNYEEDNGYQALVKQISEEGAALAKLRSKRRPELEMWVRTAVISQRKDELAGMYSRLQGYELMVQLLRERRKKELDQVEQVGVETVELEFARAELALAQDVFDRMAKRIVTLRTEQRAPARVTRLQDATVPSTPVSSPYIRLVFAVLAGLCLPFGLAVLWERIIRRVTDAGQLEEHSNLTVVGEVARLPVRTAVLSRSSSKRVGRTLGIFEESIDSLRTCLILSEPLSDMKVLAVTSGTNREGKTSVAVQLAVSIARASGEPTLLIDGDMRSPDIHKVLEIPLQPGLGDVLAGQCSLKDAIVSDSKEGVHLLPAGKLHASPHKLLGNGVLGPLFEEVRGLYRYIVVDTPPVLAAGEALVLARAADASLICAMRDVSRVDQIKKTHERLLTAGARPVGIVLNGIPAKRYTYRYGSYAYS